jgi:hypothetical protein
MVQTVVLLIKNQSWFSSNTPHHFTTKISHP